jgi:LuxR family transcriptional regulator, maltose regulon positive regulatory protein
VYQPRLVRRDRLVVRLTQSRDTPVVLIDAPAGFGKSTVLGEWDAADARPFAWLRIRDTHDDPVLLTESIADAVATRIPVDEQVYSAFHGSRQGTIKVAIPRLIESLRELTGPVVIALDDVHELRDPDSLEIVSMIGNGLPEGSQLALTSRSQPSIRLSRLRANRELTELDATDLAMTDHEANELLRACGLRLDAKSVKLLVEHTEGWPAVLYLAALSIRGADDADLAAKKFAGDDRMVADYLREEFISSLEYDELSFLTRTSILDEVSGELCDAVLDTEGSAQFLHDLAHRNALVNFVDSKDRSFRYHALLREMLQFEFHRLSPRDEATLHERASAWYAQRADYDRAVPHAIAAGDVDAAGALIWSQAPDYASAGREATLERWLDRFTKPQIDASPALCLVRANCALAAADGVAVSHWTNQAVGLIERMPRGAGSELKVAADALRLAGSAREGVVRMRTDALAAFELLPDETVWRSICRLLEGVSRHLTYEPVLARVALEDGARRGAALAPSVRGLCLAQLALLAIDEDDPDDAARLSGDSIRVSELNALADQPATALLFAVAALVEARAGNASAASGHAKHAGDLLEAVTEISPWYEAEVRIVIARGLAVLDDIAGARALLADGGRFLHQTPDAPLLREWLEQAWKETDPATLSGRWPLTPAELDVLHYLPTHLTFSESADESFVSTNTVKTHARLIYSKFGVSTRTEAVEFARTAGLITDGPPTALHPPD